MSTYRVSGQEWEPAGPVRLSPDGRYAAIASLRLLGDDKFHTELWVTVVDLATGQTAVHELIVAADQAQRLQVGASHITSGSGAIAGLAWDDDRTLRVAWYEVPEAGVHWLADVIEVSTLLVPGS